VILLDGVFIKMPTIPFFPIHRPIAIPPCLPEWPIALMRSAMPLHLGSARAGTSRVSRLGYPFDLRASPL